MATTTTSPAAQLAELPTADLITQYNLAMNHGTGARTARSNRQQRINRIVDLIDARADADDAAAIAWLTR